MREKIEKSLPSEAECLEMAYQFSLDIEPEKTIDGDVLPTEILFYEEHLIKLIRYCQGNGA